MVDINKIKKALVSNKVDLGTSDHIDEPTEIFIQSLKTSQRQEDVKEAFDKLVQALTLDAFKRIKENESVAERENIKKDLQETIASIAVLADNYLQTRDNL